MNISKKGMGLALLAGLLGIGYQGVEAEDVMEEYYAEDGDIKDEEIIESNDDLDENLSIEEVEEWINEDEQVESSVEVETIIEEVETNEELIESSIEVIESIEEVLETSEEEVETSEEEVESSEEVIETSIEEVIESSIEEVIESSEEEIETSIEEVIEFSEEEIETSIEEVIESSEEEIETSIEEVIEFSEEEIETSIEEVETSIEEIEISEEVLESSEEEVVETSEEVIVINSEEDLAGLGIIREDDFLEKVSELPKDKEVKESIKFNSIEKDENGVEFEELQEGFTEKGKQISDYKLLEKLPTIVDAGTALKLHQVKYGDNLYRIALNNGLSLTRLKELNKLTDNLILPGQKLIVEDVVTNNDKHIERAEVNAKGYQIDYGDTLYRIALNHGVTVDAIKKANNLTSNMIHPGQTLTIPTNKVLENTYGKVENSETRYKVEDGNSLWGIATKYGVTIYELKQWNKDVIKYGTIHPGQELIIKKREEISISKPKPSTTIVESTNTGKFESVTMVDKVVREAEKYLGTPYVWGGRKPGGFDCSGLMQHVFLEATGHQIGWWTGDQQYAGPMKSVDQAQKGDLYFWGDLGNTYHVALATGGGNYIHAPQPGDVVKYAKVNNYFKPTFAISMAKFLK